MSLAALAAVAIDEVTRLGPQFADVRAVDDESESVDVRDGRVERVSRSASRGVGIRVLVDGAWGFAATADQDGGAVRDAARLAVELARASGRVAHEPVRLDDSPPCQGGYVTPHRTDPLEMPVAEKTEYLLAATAAAREVPGVSLVEASTDAWRRRTVYRSSAGAAIEQTVLHAGGGLVAYAVGGGESQRRSYPTAFRGQFFSGGWEGVLALDLPGHAAATGREAVALLDAPELPSRPEATVVLDSSQLAMQIHESIGHPLELDRILGMEQAYAGGSFVRVGDRDRLRYASPIVSVTADATTPGALGTFGFDDEGVRAGSAPLISGGVLVGFLSNRETAAAVGLASNGTARADSWGSIPLIRMNNVSLAPGADDAAGLAEIVAATDDGFLLRTNRSWSIDDRRTNFQFACEAAYEIRNGSLGRLYRNPTYAGRTLDFWRSCDALGGRSDWRVWSVPICGKGQPSQLARVGHGAPTGRFRAAVGIR
ncbi:TldD/PmbA family protein [Micromonospora sp. NPDC049559]|uniref:TldD/PmbA family protein n=1 Tax=Micromonospora sp. NPDC049559 TaxID=3155923 RepID=UPI00344ACF53